MKFPFIQCFTGDWLKDPAVSMLSPAARGIWWDLICVMHESDRSGVITGSLAMLSRLARCSTDELSGALTEIKACRTGDVEQDGNGVVTVINRRMKREADARENGAKRVEQHRARDACNAPVTDLKRPILHSSESESSDKASKRDAGQGLTARQVEVAQFAESVLNGQWVNDAGKWVTRIKVDADKVFRVMADVRSAVVERRVKTSPAQMAEHNWKIFK